jgi:hypothetical protein
MVTEQLIFFACVNIFSDNQPQTLPPGVRVYTNKKPLIHYYYYYYYYFYFGAGIA